MNNISYLHLKKQGRARGTGPLLDLRTDREASKARSKLVKQLEDRAAVCVWVGMCVCVCCVFVCMCFGTINCVILFGVYKKGPVNLI